MGREIQYVYVNGQTKACSTQQLLPDPFPLCDTCCLHVNYSICKLPCY